VTDSVFDALTNSCANSQSDKRSNETEEQLLFFLATFSHLSETTKDCLSKLGSHEGQEHLLLFTLSTTTHETTKDCLTNHGSDEWEEHLLLLTLLFTTTHETSKDGSTEHGSDEWEKHLLLLLFDMESFE
jgi:hypothetical protein